MRKRHPRVPLFYKMIFTISPAQFTMSTNGQLPQWSLTHRICVQRAFPASPDSSGILRSAYFPPILRPNRISFGLLWTYSTTGRCDFPSAVGCVGSTEWKQSVQPVVVFSILAFNRAISRRTDSTSSPVVSW